MGVDFKWLAVDRQERIYVLWADKWGAHPHGTCLEDATPKQEEALRALLRLDAPAAEQPAYAYAARDRDAPTVFARDGGRGTLTLADVPKRLRKFVATRLAVDDPPATLDVAGIDGLTWPDEALREQAWERASAQICSARRSRSARILDGDEVADAATAKRAHVQQIAAYLVAAAALDSEPQPDLSSVLGSLAAAPVFAGIDTAGWPAALDVPADPACPQSPRAQSGMEAYFAVKVLCAAAPAEAEALRAAVEGLVAALTAALDDRPRGSDAGTPLRVLDFGVATNVVLVAFPPPPRATWLAVGRDDRVFVFVTGAKGARPADVLERADEAALAALRRVLFDDAERLTGRASYYEHLGDGAPGAYLLAGGKGSLAGADLPAPWAERARVRAVSHESRQPGVIDVGASVTPPVVR